MIRRIYRWFKSRRVNENVDTSQKATILDGFRRGAKFDDRIDVDTDIGNWDAFKLMGRAYALIGEVKGLFTAKFFLDFAPLWPLLYLGWLYKIIADHVILRVPLVVENVNFPPHMIPILRMLEGKPPEEIMFFVSMIFLFGLFLVGIRARGTGAGLFGGRDEASRAENAISAGGSDLGGIWGIVEFWVNVRLTQRMANNFRTRVFDRLTRSKMELLDDHRTGDSVYRVLYDTASVPHAVYELTLAPFATFAAIATTAYQISWTYGEIAPWMVFVVCLPFPVVIIVTWPSIGLIRRVNQNKRAAGSDTTNTMEESLDNMAAVQSLGGMNREKSRFAKRNAAAYWRERIAMVVGIILSNSINLIVMPIGFIVSYAVSEGVHTGQLTVGDFGALYGMYMGLSGSLRYVGGLWVRIQDNIAALRRVYFFLDFETEQDLHTDGTPLPEIKRQVLIENVSYEYPDGKLALRNVDLDLRLNSLVAIVGPTGSGKTSLAYLIPAFLQPTDGKVTIDGFDLKDVDLDTLRNQIAYVFQEHLLMAESIRSNLQLANPDASEQQIFEALEAAGCMEFVDELPDGIDSIVGKMGDTLSVGQQQRISIARGLVRDAKILILDEPTAALDPKTENDLVGSLRDATKGRLVIVIAHRLSTVRMADTIIFLEEGEVKDMGDHETLMANPESPYRRFVELQTSV
ncbi:MAG: ABC transporter ATP-binding protein [Gammaproteobacteria bacterium]|nr:ABC transporter ATP-binding protein [Gammaproteobacteria bacterium]